MFVKVTSIASAIVDLAMMTLRRRQGGFGGLTPLGRNGNMRRPRHIFIVVMVVLFGGLIISCIIRIVAVASCVVVLGHSCDCRNGLPPAAAGTLLETIRAIPQGMGVTTRESAAMAAAVLASQSAPSMGCR